MRHSARPTLLLISRASELSSHAALYCQQNGYWLEQFGEVGEIYSSLTQQPPALVLLDLELTGSQFAQIIERLRLLCEVNNTPIVTLGPTYMQKSLAPDALRLGAHAFLPTPISFELLSANLDLAVKQRQQRQSLLGRLAELEGLQREVEEERLLANAMLTDRLGLDEALAQSVERWVAPAQRFSGDLAMAEAAPDGSFRVLLADGVGHGLPAALTVMPLVRTFRAMARAGYGISCIVHELNRVIRDSLPKYRFVAVSLLMVDPNRQRLECWNGGNPPICVFDDQGRELWRASSDHVPLGIMPIEELALTTANYHYQVPCHVFMCSDGLSELEGVDGEALGQDRLIQHLQALPPAEWLGGVQNLSADHLQGAAAHDDISVAIVHCPLRHASQNLESTPTVLNDVASAEFHTALQNAALGVAPELLQDRAAELLAFAIRLQPASLLARELVPLARRLLRQIGPRYESNEALLQGLQILFACVVESLQSNPSAAVNDTKVQVDGPMVDSPVIGMNRHGQVGISLRALAWPINGSGQTLEVMEIEVSETGMENLQPAFVQKAAIDLQLASQGIDPEYLKVDAAGRRAVLLLPLGFIPPRS